jgi:aromatic ring-opening dioxygenase LigB subunit
MRGTVSIGAIAPHGEEAIPDACDEDTRSLAVATQRAMAEMARRVAGTSPDVAVVATPHNVHVGGRMAVLTSSAVAGELEGAATRVALDCRVDREFALAVIDGMNAGGAPTVDVSFGGNDPVEAVAPLDWGSLVPLWHLARHVSDLPVVLVAPCRELDADAHVHAGAAIVRAARRLGRRIAFIASADQGHGHDADGPYGFHPESAAFDARVVDIVRHGDLAKLLEIGEEEAVSALADSWWQMLMLLGALEEDGDDFRSELLAYEAPTYFGMLTAVFESSAASSNT